MNTEIEKIKEAIQQCKATQFEIKNQKIIDAHYQLEIWLTELLEIKTKNAIKIELNIVFRVIFRIIGLPFFALATLVAQLIKWLIHCYFFIRHGGELISYTRRFNPHSIGDILNKLDELNKNQ